MRPRPRFQRINQLPTIGHHNPSLVHFIPETSVSLVRAVKYNTFLTRLAAEMKSFFGQLGFCLAVLVASFADATTLIPASPLPINSLTPAPSVSLLPSTRPSRVLTVQWIPKGFHVVHDISYVIGAGRSRTLDLYLPDVRTTPRPVMVWIHGGGWRSGDKSAPPGLGILTRGFIVVSINYRLSSDALFPGRFSIAKPPSDSFASTPAILESRPIASAYGAIPPVDNLHPFSAPPTAAANTREPKALLVLPAMCRPSAIGSALLIFRPPTTGPVPAEPL